MLVCGGAGRGQRQNFCSPHFVAGTIRRLQNTTHKDAMLESIDPGNLFRSSWECYYRLRRLARARSAPVPVKSSAAEAGSGACVAPE